MLFCHILATSKSGDTVLSEFGCAPDPADNTFGNAGAPGVVGWNRAAARALVPSAVSACSYIASNGWSYIKPLLARTTVRRSSPTVQTTPNRGPQLFLSRRKSRDASNGAAA